MDEQMNTCDVKGVEDEKSLSSLLSSFSFKLNSELSRTIINLIET